MPQYSIVSINHLPYPTKREIYSRIIPKALCDKFQIPPDFEDQEGHNLLLLNCEPGSTMTEMALYHRAGFPDPILYGQITDTLQSQLHVLLYILNDPASPRFDVDRLPDGTPTGFGALARNIEAEISAMEFGLAPGQIRRGLRLLGEAIHTFEQFVLSLGKDMFFIEPLYYHNAILFERHGFGYAKGRSLMDRIQSGFSINGDLIPLLDGSTPFRKPEAAKSIRLRSWALHDNILGQPFFGVTMFKKSGHPANLDTSQGCQW